MDFRFTEDQQNLIEAARTFFKAEHTLEYMRHIREGKTASLWTECAELGLFALMASEEMGGMEQSLQVMAAIAEIAGYVAFSEPFVETAGIIIPLLTEMKNQDKISEIIAGHTRIGLLAQDFSRNHQADACDMFIKIAQNNELIDKNDVLLEKRKSIDPLRHLFEVSLKNPSPLSCHKLASWHGAVLTAAQLCGLAHRMIDLSVEYAKERQQFGQAIGAFQAVKHQLATAYTQIEFTRPIILLAASKNTHVVHQAKIAAIDTAFLAAETALQIHGGIGYTFESSLHLFMKRAWALCGEWGDRNFHMNQLEDIIFDDNALLGPGTTF